MNPLLNDALSHSDPCGSNTLIYAPNAAWLSSRNLVLIQEDDLRSSWDEDQFQQLLSHLGSLLRKLRHLSGQADMPKEEDVVAVRFGTLDILPELPNLGVDSSSSVQTYLLATAVSNADLVKAAALSDDFDPPIYSVLILDSIAAFQSKDYRVSILLSAMAMEVGFGAALDAAHDSILQTPSDPRYRVQKIPINGGDFLLKDSIYERLREKIDFSIRMHEMSLYALGKSLRTENDVLYKKAMKLYRSRNKIVHLGTTDEAAEEVLPMDRFGAFTALEVVTDCLTWLGLNPGFKLPKLQFLTGDDFIKFAQALDPSPSA